MSDHYDPAIDTFSLIKDTDTFKVWAEKTNYVIGFLKDVDNPILTEYNGVTLTTDQTITGIKTFNSSDTIFQGKATYNNEAEYNSLVNYFGDENVVFWTGAGHVFVDKPILIRNQITLGELNAYQEGLPKFDHYEKHTITLISKGSGPDGTGGTGAVDTFDLIESSADWKAPNLFITGDAEFGTTGNGNTFVVDATVDINGNTTIDGEDIQLTGITEIGLSAPTIDIDSTTLIDIDGDNIQIDGTTEIGLTTPIVDIDSDNVSISETTTGSGSVEINTTDFNVFASNDIILRPTFDLDIDATNTYIDGDQLLIGTTESLTFVQVNSLTTDINSNSVTIDGDSLQADILIGNTEQINLLDIEAAATRIDGSTLDIGTNLDAYGAFLPLTSIEARADTITLVAKDATEATQHEIALEADLLDIDATNTTIDGTDLTIGGDGNLTLVDVNATDTTIDGDNIQLTGTTEIGLTTATLDIDSTTLIDIDGIDIQIDGTTEIGLTAPTVDINGTTTTIDGTDIQVTGTTEIGLTTATLDIDATDTTIDGDQLLIGTNQIDDGAGGLTPDPLDLVDIDSNNIQLDGATEIGLTSTGTLDIDATDTTIDGNTLLIGGTDTTPAPLTDVDIKATTLDIDVSNLELDANIISLTGTHIGDGDPLTLDSPADDSIIQLDAGKIFLDSHEIRLTAVDDRDAEAPADSEIQLDAVILNLDGTTTTIDGTDLLIGGTDATPAPLTNVDIKATTLDIDSDNVSITEVVDGSGSVTIDTTTFNASATNILLDGATEIDLTAPAVDINGTTTTIDGTNLIVGGTANLTLVDVNASTFDLDATNTTIDGTDIQIAGTTEIGLTTATLDIDATDTTIDGTNLTIGGGGNLTLVDVNATTFDIDATTIELDGAIDLHSTGDIIAELGDAAGSNKLSIKDSGATEVASINSDGVIYTSNKFELGHASDTTIERASAGEITVEGVSVVLRDGVIEDLETLGANAGDNEVLISTGPGALAWESGATLRTSIGLGTTDNVGFTDLILSGNLTVNGTTTTVNSTTVTLDDPILTLGGDTAPTTNDTADRGIEFRWWDAADTGNEAKIGFFGFDDTNQRFTFIPRATNNSEAFTGTLGDAHFNNIFVDGTVDGVDIATRDHDKLSLIETNTVSFLSLDDTGKNQVLTANYVDLAADVTGVLPVRRVEDLSGINTGDIQIVRNSCTQFEDYDGGPLQETDGNPVTYVSWTPGSLDTNEPAASITHAPAQLTFGCIDLSNDVTGRLSRFNLPLASNNPADPNDPDGITTENIEDLSITNSKLALDSVSNDRIQTNAISQVKMADASVGTAELIDASNTVTPTGVTTAKIEDDAITNAKIAAVAVGTTELQNNSVTTAKLAASSVTSTELANSSVTTGKILNLSITTPKIAADAVTYGKLQRAAGTNVLLGNKTVANSNFSELTADEVRAILATGTGGGTGSAGMVDTDGSAADNQIAVWKDVNTIEGTAGLTYDGTDLTITGNIVLLTANATVDGVDIGARDHDSVTIATGRDYISISGQELTLGQIDLTADVTGTLPIANGGTGASTAAAARTNLDAQQQQDILDDIGALSSPNAANLFLVSTAPGSFALESASVARTSLGLGTGDSPQFTGLTLTNDLPITEGGTGASDAPTALKNLGVLKATTKTADYIANFASENIILVDATNATTTGNITITLPAPAANEYFTIKKIDSSTNTVTIDALATGGTTIDGANTLIMTEQWQSTTVICNGSAYFII